MTVLQTDTDLKESILQILAVRENTISGIHVKLKEMGIDTHRLVLTGYLRAMKDMEILVEKEIKPSKLYFISEKTSSDIYNIVGKVSQSINEESSPEIALSILFTLFKRPIFMREIERCGLLAPRRYNKVMPSDRLKYIEKLTRAGVSIPSNSIMIEPEGDSLRISDDILIRVLNEAFNLKRYSREYDRSPQQTL